MTRRHTTIAAAALVVAVGVSGCGVGASGSSTVTFPPESFGPSAATTGAVATTRAAIAAALGTKNLQLDDPKVPYRPPEAASFAAARRAVFQAVLPNDQSHGFISVYEFTDPASAAAAGGEEARYLGSGPGRVNFPPDTRFVMRQLGTTVLLYAWSPDNSPDPRTKDIQPALETIGTPIAVPR
ncbi:MAG: hypothetical protein ACJ77B_06715 [Chloroflexota bacterium]